MDGKADRDIASCGPGDNAQARTRGPARRKRRTQGAEESEQASECRRQVSLEHGAGAWSVDWSLWSGARSIVLGLIRLDFGVGLIIFFFFLRDMCHFIPCGAGLYFDIISLRG